MFAKIRLRNNSGFTLVEVLVSLAIFLVILGIIYGIYFSGQDLWEVERNKLDLQAEARKAIAYMSQELRRTTRTSAQSPSPNLSIPNSPNNNRITFYLPRDADTNGIPDIVNDQIIWDLNDPIEYRYYPGQKELRRRQGIQERILGRDVSSVQLCDNGIDGSLSSNELKITLTLNKATSRQRNVPFTLSAIIRLRN